MTPIAKPFITISNPKFINARQTLEKIFDVQRTIFEPKIETTISEKGIKYTKLKYFLDGNIQKFEIEKSKETADTEVSKD